MDRTRVFTILATIAIAGPAIAADSPLDGTYTGTRMLRVGTEPECGPTKDKLTVTVKDGQFSYLYGPTSLNLAAGDDGLFKGTAAAGGLHGGRKFIRVQGKIAASRLRARLNVRVLQRLVCSYRWSLAKQ